MFVLRREYAEQATSVFQHALKYHTPGVAGYHIFRSFKFYHILLLRLNSPVYVPFSCENCSRVFVLRRKHVTSQRRQCFDKYVLVTAAVYWHAHVHASIACAEYGKQKPVLDPVIRLESVERSG